MQPLVFSICTLGIFSKRVISAAFPIYCFHFLVVHTVYALRKCHCISKIHLEILRSEDSESTLQFLIQNHLRNFQYTNFLANHKFRISFMPPSALPSASYTHQQNVRQAPSVHQRCPSQQFFHC